MIRIFKTSLSSSSDSPEGLTTELGQQASPGRRGFGPKSSGHRSPGGGASILSNKRLILPFLAFVAVLAAGLLFLLPGGLLQAQSAEQFFTYAENGTGPVATFTASDPEGATPGFWSLVPNDAFNTIEGVEEADAADVDLFEIDQSGVLSFKSPRSYEDNSAQAPLKEYRVTVQVSDGSEVEYFKAYVTVTDVEETGKITWTVTLSGVDPISGLQQFQPGAVLTPSVTDPDAVTTDATDGAISAGITYRWYRGSTAISGADGTGVTYTVVSADVGNRVRVDATYSDGNGPAETVIFTSPYPVQEFRRLTDNTVPVFSPTVVTRRVEENSKGNVGAPVTATDANGDKLTYSVSGDDATDRFKIDPATGQLMTAVKLDYETETSYQVTVTATDSSGNVTEPDSTHTPAMVTINVGNVDEKPTFVTGSVAEGVVAVQTEGMTGIDTNADSADVQAATLAASDPDGKKVTFTLMGSDAGSFELAGDTDTGNGVSQELSFKEKTDYEMPGDRNRDNVYEVTVRASDGTLYADRALIIKVINDATEGGKVTLSPEDAVVGVELTATLTHMEGGVAASGQIANEMWKWQKSAELGANGACDENTSYDTDIDNATKTTYRPVSADKGSCLRAMATYNYQFAAEETMAESAGTEVLVSQANQVPKFKEGTSTFRVVAENVMANAADDTIEDVGTGTPATNDNVGSPIVATDANGDDPTYSLGGAGASLFRVRPDNGQIEVKGKLNHEANASHTVTLMANDGSGTSNATASITVTIYVTDVDGAPTIKDRADSRAEGMRTVDYRENGTGPVARFTATDPEGARPIVWSLTTETVGGDVTVPDIADRALFDIDQSGVLNFKEPHSYEASSDSTDDNYQVVVQASDGNNNGYFELTVSVTNMEETGKVTWTVAPVGITLNPLRSLQQFQPGAVLTPIVTDPDGGVTGTTYKWYRGSTAISGETGTGITYTVVADDVGNRIRVDATYTDASSGPAETVRFTSENPVQAAAQPGTNTDPAFAATAVTRRVEENSVGNVGGPVTATDANGDKLTYSVSGDDATNRFKIDPATGQLMTAVKLDYETETSYQVTVTATDSSGAATSGDTNAVVTINVIDVDEKPRFVTDSNTAGVLNAGGVVAAQTEGMTGIDTNADSADVQAATLVASDPEGKDVTLALMGVDAGSFELAGDTDTGNGVSQELSFKEKTDYEMPGDRNRDNVYEVTVRASDGTLYADRMLIIKVINDASESGKVTLSPEDAVVGVELTATLTHMEGGVAASGQIANEMWKWQKSAELGANGACDENTSYDTDIDNATKTTYTPAFADKGSCLRAMATYNYQFAAEETMAESAGTEVLASQTNQAPKFKEGTSTFRVVMENVEAADPSDDAAANDVTTDNVGSPIVADDANGDMPTYTLSGPGASKFRVRSNGQIEVKDKLDHDTNASHTVMLMANDGSGTSNATASITVTIYVTDVDEKPVIMVVPTENQAPIFRTSSTTRSIPEGQSLGRPIGVAVTATDPNPGDSLAYTLEGTDAASFSIVGNTGQLRTRVSLDYNTKSTYTVIVRATDGAGLYDTITVTITVTEAEEQMGEVTLWDGMVALTMAPQVGDTITGAVMDPDGGVTSETWQWSRTMDDMDSRDMDSWMPIEDATNAAYMVMEGDTGYYLRVMATYMDAVGTDTAMEYSPATMMVGAEVVDTLLERYDANDNAEIDLDEVFKAIDDYFDYVDRLTLEEVYEIVDLYFEG